MLMVDFVFFFLVRCRQPFGHLVLVQVLSPFERLVLVLFQLCILPSPVLLLLDLVLHNKALLRVQH